MLPRRLYTALLFALAGACIWQSLDLGWGASDARDGTRYKVGPAVISHVLLPHQPVSPTEPCAIDQRSKEPPPCLLELRGGDAARLLHAGSRILWLAALAALLAAVLSLFPHRLGRWSWVPGVAAILALWFEIWAMETLPPKAFDFLIGLNYGIGGTKGMMEVALALLLLPIAAVTGRAPWHPRRLAIEVGMLVVLGALTLLALSVGYWPLVFGVEPPITAGLFLFYLARSGRPQGDRSTGPTSQAAPGHSG